MFEHLPIGRHLHLSVCGASHAPSLGFTLENFPAGFSIDAARLKAFMERRAPGRDNLSTARHEEDAVSFVSGVSDGRTTGAPIVGRIANQDVRPQDYGSERTIPRPGHADFGQWLEQGRIPTGGGANSGRLTAALCGAGGICLQYLARRGIVVRAELDTVGGAATGFDESIRSAKKALDSVGGTIRCRVTGLPAGYGGALFAGVESGLAAALFGIPGVNGVEFGNGFAAADLRGSENDDCFAMESGRVVTVTNNHGGVLGGRTSGMPLEFRIACKPTPTVLKPIASVDLATRQAAVCAMKGRHDPCIARRAVPVVEAVTAFAIADLLLSVEAETPRICLTLTGATLEEDLAQYEAHRFFCDMVELRVDLLQESERSRLADFPARVPAPVVLTFRRTCDGGAFDGSEDVRVAFFRSALSKPGFAFVDFEDDFRHDDLTSLARASGTRIIRSCHMFDGDVPDIVPCCRALRGETDEIPKLAFLPKSLADVARLFDETRAFTEFTHILCAMGPLGFVSRARAAETHSMLTYASASGLGGLGHVSPDELVRTYRIRSQPCGASLFGVTGWPLVFTRSPELHNAAFSAADRDAVLVPVPSPTAEEALAFMRRMNMRGLAVTYPHKQAICPLLDECAAEVRAIGAANTVVRENGRLVGHNTDATGFAVAITAFVGAADLTGRKAAVVGAGGAARAVVYALRKLGVSVCIFNRTLQRAQTLAREFDCTSAPLGPDGAETFSAYADLVVQCAAPDADPAHFDPLAWYVFTGRELVYDLVYEPEVTPTLARAKAAGCKIENGMSMLVAQAREQRRLWFDGED